MMLDVARAAAHPPPMHTPRVALLAALLAAGCRSDPGASTGVTSGGLCEEGCTCQVDDDCGEGLVCASRMCVPALGDSSGESSSSGSTESESPSGGTTSTPSDDSTSGGEAGSSGEAGETTAESTETSGSGSSSSTPTMNACGDGMVDDGEACDDGNLEPGDGCDAVCDWEPWQHEGVAHDVPVADLRGWELCWSGTYEAGALVSGITTACNGDHLLLACRPTDSDVLTVAAHAPREDVLFPVDYGAGERHESNGVNWYWSPSSNIEGFAPSGDTSPCELNGDGVQPDHMCWLNADDVPLTFLAGARCGTVDVDDASDWSRVVFQISGPHHTP